MQAMKYNARTLIRFTHSRRSVKDVVVIGGGAAGLSLLNAVKSSSKLNHLDVSLVDGLPLASKFTKWAETMDGKPFENRVISLTPQSVKFLEKIGAWQNVVHERTMPYDEMRVWDGESNASIEFDGWSSESGIVATMIENSNLQQALYLSNGIAPSVLHSQVKEITTDSVTNWPVVTLEDGTEFMTRLLVGADGQQSPVRKFAGIEARGWDYNRFGVVATLNLEYDDFKAVAYQRFLRTGTLAVLPMPDGKATLVWATLPDRASWLRKLEPKIMGAMVNAGLRLDMVDIDYLHTIDPANSKEILSEIDWRLEQRNENHSSETDVDQDYPAYVEDVNPGSVAAFPLKMRHADSYIAERVALVGDAAHATHPLTGQGLNMGQRDVQALVSALTQAVDRGLDIGSSLALEPYPRSAYASNHILLGVNDKFHKLYSTDFWPVVKLRSLGLSAFNWLDSAKQFAIRQAQ